MHLDSTAEENLSPGIEQVRYRLVPKRRPLGTAALHRRTRGHSLLAHPERRRMLQVISQMPGASYYEIKAWMTPARRSLRYHLNRLLDEGFVRCDREAARAARHYIEPAGRRALRQLEILRLPTAQIVLATLARRSTTWTWLGLSRALGMSLLGTKVWVYRLMKGGLVAAAWAQGRLWVRCTPEGRRALGLVGFIAPGVAIPGSMSILDDPWPRARNREPVQV